MILAAALGNQEVIIHHGKHQKDANVNMVQLPQRAWSIETASYCRLTNFEGHSSTSLVEERRSYASRKVSCV